MLLTILLKNLSRESCAELNALQDEVRKTPIYTAIVSGFVDSAEALFTKLSDGSRKIVLSMDGNKERIPLFQYELWQRKHPEAVRWLEKNKDPIDWRVDMQPSNADKITENSLMPQAVFKNPACLDLRGTPSLDEDEGFVLVQRLGCNSH